jgi:hypothetical protein
MWSYATGGWFIKWIFSLWKFDWEFCSLISNSVRATLQYPIWKSRIFCSAVSILPWQCQKAWDEFPRSNSGIYRRSRPGKPNLSRILHYKCLIHKLSQFSREFTSHDVLWSDNKVWWISRQCRYLIVPEVPDFSAGVSQHLLINIKLHRESDDFLLTSSYPLLMARRGGKDFLSPWEFVISSATWRMITWYRDWTSLGHLRIQFVLQHPCGT